MSRPDPKPIVIQVSYTEGYNLAMNLPWDAAAADMAQAMRSIMYWLTFHPESIDNVIPEPDSVPPWVCMEGKDG